MDARTRCLGVDDHPVVRQGLDLLFGHLDDLELVGTVETGEEALDAVTRLSPQIVLIDVRLPGIDGISAVKRIHEASPSVQFVVFSAYGDKRLLSDAIAAGARGYVMKGSPPEDLHSPPGYRLRVGAAMAAQAWAQAIERAAHG